VRYFNVTQNPATGLDNAQFTIYYEADDEVNEPAYLTMLKDDGGGNWINLGGSAAGTPSGSITSGSFTTFSTFALGNLDGGDNPLPVTWLDFTAELTSEGNALLNWETVHEVNNDGFYVERSKDGKTYASLGFVKGHGTSPDQHSYSFIDNGLTESGTLYYRLKQVDYDGTTDYSKVIYLDASAITSSSSINLYPNPTSGTIQVSGLPVDFYQVSVLSLGGKTMKQFQNIPLQNISPFLSDYLTTLERGSYIVRFNSDTFHSINRLVLK
jgi:hypothetical protein